jgi:hypothetical protein
MRWQDDQAWASRLIAIFRVAVILLCMVLAKGFSSLIPILGMESGY